MTMGRPVAGLCGRAFLRPTPADPNERPPARAMLRQTPILPIRSRCARAQWPVGWRRLAMELAIQVARVPARPRDGSARALRPARRAPRTGAVSSRPPAQHRREATRGFAKPGFRPERSIRQAPALRCQEKFVELALGIADLVEKLTQLSFDQVVSVRRRLGDHDRLQLLDRRQQLLSVGVPVPPRIFSGEGAAALAPRSVWLRKPGSRPRPAHRTARSLARWFRPAWAIPTQPFINHAD
jgi:hypothetical protein